MVNLSKTKGILFLGTKKEVKICFKSPQRIAFAGNLANLRNLLGKKIRPDLLNKCFTICSLTQPDFFQVLVWQT